MDVQMPVFILKIGGNAFAWLLKSVSGFHVCLTHTGTFLSHLNQGWAAAGRDPSQRRSPGSPSKRGLTFCSSQVSTSHTTTPRMHWSLGPLYKEGPEAQRGAGLA